MPSRVLHLYVTGLPQFKECIEKITALHVPHDEEAEFFHRDEPSEHCEPSCTERTCGGHTATVQVCTECGYDHEDGYPMFRVWPCPTMRAIAELIPDA